MGIKSTQYISRERAIERIIDIITAARNDDYKYIDHHSSEYNYDIRDYVSVLKNIDIMNIDKWTDMMVEDTMDYPFIRYSMFDNYLVEEE